MDYSWVVLGIFSLFLSGLIVRDFYVRFMRECAQADLSESFERNKSNDLGPSA